MQPEHSGTEAVAPPPTAALAAVLAPAFLRKLDRLQLTVRRSLSTRPGNTPMPRGAQGSGIELENSPIPLEPMDSARRRRPVSVGDPYQRVIVAPTKGTAIGGTGRGA